MNIQIRCMVDLQGQDLHSGWAPYYSRGDKMSKEAADALLPCHMGPAAGLVSRTIIVQESCGRDLEVSLWKVESMPSSGSDHSQY